MTLPIETEYAVGKTSEGNPCVVIKTRQVDWDGVPQGDATEHVVKIPEIEQLVGFCLRCGNQDLMKAVRRPVYKMIHGPDHPHAK